MRAKKKNQINFERKEKLIHKETMRFLSLLEVHTSSTINNQPYFPELYENIVNHIRDYLSNPSMDDDNLREYLDDEHTKVKNFFLEENFNSEDDIKKNNIHEEQNKDLNSESINYTQTIFDITTQSHSDENQPYDTEKGSNIKSSKQISNILSDSEIDAKNETTASTSNEQQETKNELKKIRQTKFSNLQTFEVRPDENKNFVTLSEEPFLKDILINTRKYKFGFFRYIKYLYLTRKLKRKHKNK